MHERAGFDIPVAGDSDGVWRFWDIGSAVMAFGYAPLVGN
jgi:hypothetical protein